MTSITSLNMLLRPFVLAVLVVVTIGASRAPAAELLMFEEKWCHWCDRWNSEVGVIYDKTEEGRRAPLRRIDIHDALPENVELVSRPQYTPTFVLIENGRELARIEGYPGEDFFWGLLGRMLEKLPQADGRKSPAQTN